jgi:hypothetical protein
MFVNETSLSIPKMKVIKDGGVRMDMAEHKFEEWMEWIMRRVYEGEAIVGITQRIHGPFERIARLKSSIYNQIERLPVRSK